MNLQRSDWEVLPIPEHRDAVAIIERFHQSHSCTNTSTYRHGLYRRNSGPALWGATVWLPPTKPAGMKVAGDGWQGVLCLSRLVIDPRAPRNAASFLLGRSMQMIDRHRWPVLLTYADTGMGHTGAIYKATNWEYDGESPAGDTWIHPLRMEMRGRKRGKFNYSADEMRAMGFERRPNMPKIRFVHRVQP